ncbi:glycosyltransferase family 2 protein [Halothiobacillus sp. DCM-1]|uniref:glycosyltransferase family 2 protein n=1 Tax=Halothiobacillus sp. DCM-1 TaxID=3112558 RepID=UPI00324A64DE
MSQLSTQDVKVSVIIPTFNRSAVIAESINSVLEQSFKELELIIVDDGSSDNTEDIINKINDKRVVYIRNEQNKGAAESRNIGIWKASAEIIAFQDSDDIWLRDKLKKSMLALGDNPDAIGVFSSFIQLDPKGKNFTRKGFDSKGKNQHDEILYKNFIGTPCAVVRKKYLLEVGGFDENLPALEDWDLFIRLTKLGRMAYIPESMVVTRKSRGSLSADKSADRDALEMIYNKNLAEIKSKNMLDAKWHSRLGQLHILTGRQETGRAHLFSSLKLNPKNIRYFVECFSSVTYRGFLYKILANVYSRVSLLMGSRKYKNQG